MTWFWTKSCRLAKLEREMNPACLGAAFTTTLRGPLCRGERGQAQRGEAYQQGVPTPGVTKAPLSCSLWRLTLKPLVFFSAVPAINRLSSSELNFCHLHRKNNFYTLFSACWYLPYPFGIHCPPRGLSPPQTLVSMYLVTPSPSWKVPRVPHRRQL